MLQRTDRYRAPAGPWSNGVGPRELREQPEPEDEHRTSRSGLRFGGVLTVLSYQDIRGDLDQSGGSERSDDKSRVLQPHRVYESWLASRGER